MKVRYIRESMNGSNSNSGCHWCEIQAINYESTNIALNKKVTCEGGSYEKGTLDMITNGNTSVDDYIYFRNDPQKTISVIVDLGNIEDIDNIKVWHYHGGGRIYKNILLEVSLDGVKWTKIFNSNENGEYAETEEGKTHKLIDDRLTSLSEKASLHEITSFYDKYIEKTLLDKEVLVNILNSKGLDVSTEDKMLNLINMIEAMAINPIKTVKAGDTNKLIYLNATRESCGLEIGYGTGGASSNTIMTSPFNGSVRLKIKTRMANSGYSAIVSIVKKDLLDNSTNLYSYTENSTTGVLRSYDINLSYGDVIILNCSMSSGNILTLPHLSVTYDM